MKKNKISLPLISLQKKEEIENIIKEGQILLPEEQDPFTKEGTTETPTEETKEPETTGTTEPTETPSEPISKRMDDLLILKMDPKSRLSGNHPKINKHPKWMINPTFNGRERWMDLSKEIGWNLERKEIILKRSGIQHRGMEGFETRDFNPETDKDFTFLPK